MFYNIDQNLKKFLFQDAPNENCAWVGDVYELVHDAQELVPVRFGFQDFLVGFASPFHEAGNDAELLANFSASEADGFPFHSSARLVKFARTESDVNNQYKPDVWKLNVAGQIYQFSRTLGMAAIAHAEALPGCQQYFFWAATERLALLYERTFRYIDKACVPGMFTPILEKTGVLNGYQRT